MEIALVASLALIGSLALIFIGAFMLLTIHLKGKKHNRRRKTPRQSAKA